MEGYHQRGKLWIGVPQLVNSFSSETNIYQ